MLQREKVVRLEERLDGFRSKPTALCQFGRSEDFARKSQEWFAPLWCFEWKVEWLFGAIGDGGRKMLGRELAPDHFVLLCIQFCFPRKSKREVDEAVIEEGGSVFYRVCHGVFILPDERPIGEPMLILKGKEAVEGVVFDR